MLSKTSFCKLLKKNLTRFAPLWALYMLFLLLCVVLCLDEANLDYWFTNNFVGLMHFMPLISLAYAFVAADLLFGDLYTPRMCYALHALPVKRETTFAANVTAGLLAAAVPNALFCLICAPLLAQTPVPGGLALAGWFYLAAMLGYVFFLGCAVLCAMLSGNRLGHAALYGTLNLGATLAYMLVDNAYTPLLYGVLTPGKPFQFLSPVVHMIYNMEPVELTSIQVPIGPDLYDTHGTYAISQGWGYMAGIAVLGIVLALAALALYRRRHLEKAGDFLAVKHLSNLVLVALSLGAGTVATVVIQVYSGRYSLLFLAAGLIVGWFAGCMLLERTTRVFRPKSFLGLGAVLLAVALSLGLTKLDVFRIEDRVPAADQIQRILLDGHIPVDPQDFELVRAFHTQALTDRVPEDDTYTEDRPLSYNYSILYELENGSDMRRSYTVPEGTPAWDSARKLSSTVSAVMYHTYYGADDRETVRTEQDFRNLTGEPLYIRLCGQQLPPELVSRETMDLLLEAMLQDLQEGTLSQDWVFHPRVPIPGTKDAPFEYTLNASFPIDDPDPGRDPQRYLRLSFFPDSKHTLAALEELGIREEELQEAIVQSYETKYFG